MILFKEKIGVIKLIHLKIQEIEICCVKDILSKNTESKLIDEVQF